MLSEKDLIYFGTILLECSQYIINKEHINNCVDEAKYIYDRIFNENDKNDMILE